MLKPFLLFAFNCLLSPIVFGQSYDAYFTGNETNIQTQPEGGICLMGGSTEDDNAMRWFLRQANGGDILVLRASGSDGYNNYFFSELGIGVNSVETIVFNNANASSESYIHEKIKQAEAIWFAGGDQWKYVSYWRNTAIDSLINEALKQRNIVIGGTSAGMAIMGGFYFTAQNGTIVSSSALSNPYNERITVDSLSFLSNNFLSDVITDTHYDNPNRKGRHVVFLSRILTTYNIPAKGIACDEHTAVCIDTSGIARIYGEHPRFDDNAYFIQTNCNIEDLIPEISTANTPLTWNLDKEALKVYRVKGTTGGTNSFDLNTWQDGVGGEWLDWSVQNGFLFERIGSAISCLTTSNNTVPLSKFDIEVFPNPSMAVINIKIGIQNLNKEYKLDLVNALGEQMKHMEGLLVENIRLDMSTLSSGVYYLQMDLGEGKIGSTKIIHLNR